MSRKARLQLSLIAVAVFLGAASTEAAIVVNGSFEAVQIGYPYQSANPADIPGWTHTGAPGDALLWAIGYADGSGSVTVAGQGRQFVTMGAGYLQNPAYGSWQQTLIGLTPGATYRLDFRMASEANFSGAQSLTVDFNGTSSTAAQTFLGPVPTANYWNPWVAYTMNFVASGTTVDLRFSSTTSFDIGLDDVSVTPVPEPTTMLAGALLLLPLAAGARRKFGQRH